VLGSNLFLSAQIQMPDAREMSGIPRPVDDLPNGSISIRLVRGDLSNNITDHPVDLQADGRTLTVRTDGSGRAEFRDLPPGNSVKALAVVDGERLESQSFAVPSSGGVRMLLVATDKEREARAAAEAAAPAITAPVVIGGESRIILEPDDEDVRIFYLLDVMNNTRAPANPQTPFIFDLPDEAVSATVLEGSTKLASASGTRVRVQGPFPPGRTIVQIGYDLPARDGAIEISQTFPALFEQVAVIAKRVGNSQLSSAQLDRREDMPAEGAIYTVAGGSALPAGTPLVLSIAGMPYRSRAPRWIAMTIAAMIVLIGVWAARRPIDQAERRSERGRLITRREKLFQDLVRLETDHRQGRVDRARFETRRESLLGSLEQIYAALDADIESMRPPGPRHVGAPAGQLGTS
jgi:hypothetical protein